MHKVVDGGWPRGLSNLSERTLPSYYIRASYSDTYGTFLHSYIKLTAHSPLQSIVAQLMPYCIIPRTPFSAPSLPVSRLDQRDLVAFPNQYCTIRPTSDAVFTRPGLHSNIFLIDILLLDKLVQEVSEVVLVDAPHVQQVDCAAKWD